MDGSSHPASRRELFPCKITASRRRQQSRKKKKKKERQLSRALVRSLARCSLYPGLRWDVRLAVFFDVSYFRFRLALATNRPRDSSSINRQAFIRRCARSRARDYKIHLSVHVQDVDPAPPFLYTCTWPDTSSSTKTRRSRASDNGKIRIGKGREPE